MKFSQEELKAASELIYRQMSATAQHQWPLLAEATGAEVWVKHENHTPTGAFKIRGGITYLDWLNREHGEYRGVCTATRGNHGQSIARAAKSAGLTAKIIVPRGNSSEKNAAMRAFGGELIEFGEDFDTAREEALRIAKEENLAFIPPFHRELVRGVATYGYELFRAQPDLDTVYVPIGCGSGICGVIAARDALGLDTRIIGVVSEHAPTAKLSAEAGEPIATNSAVTFADGMAVRQPVQEALDIYRSGTERIITVGETQIADAIRLYFRATHNIAEGAGAAPLAALMAEREQMKDRKVGLVLSGGNIDTDWYLKILGGGTPNP